MPLSVIFETAINVVELVFLLSGAIGGLCAICLLIWANIKKDSGRKKFAVGILYDSWKMIIGSLFWIVLVSISRLH